MPEAPAPGDPLHTASAVVGARTHAAAAAPSASGMAPAADGTTHIAAIDRDGTMICLTPSGGVFRKSPLADRYPAALPRKAPERPVVPLTAEDLPIRAAVQA